MSKHLLIIDDDDSLRTLLEIYLKKKSFKVSAMKDGMEAMLWLQEGNVPDLIIADLGMPRLDGFEFLKNCKKSGFFREIPIIMLTGMDRDEVKKKCLDLGAVTYLVKPFKFDELVEKIDNTIPREKDYNHV